MTTRAWLLLALMLWPALLIGDCAGLGIGVMVEGPPPAAGAWRIGR